MSRNPTLPDLTRPQSRWRTVEWQAYAAQQTAKAAELQKRIRAARQPVDLVVINTKLSRASRDRLRAMATRDNTTMRSMIQQAVDDYLDNLQAQDMLFTP